MTKLEKMQLAHDKLIDAAKALEAIEDVQVAMLAEQVTSHTGLIDVLRTAEAA